MKLTFRQKLILPLLMSWLCLLAVVGYNLLHTRSMRLEERMTQLASVSGIVASIAKDYDSQVASGKLPLERAQHDALDRIRALRYGSSGYFSVFDAHTMLMHIKPELTGKDVASFKDADGHSICLEAIEAAKNGGGFTTYLWAKPGDTRSTRKLTYNSLYEPWNWTFQTGLYMDDLDAVFWADLIQAAALLVGIGLLLSAAIWLLVRNVERSIGGEPGTAAEAARRIATGDLTVDIALKRGDSNSLMFAIHAMKERLASIVADVHRGTDAIALAAGEISAGNHDLSSRTETQASALQQTASSMEQLTATVRQNADNSRQANQLAVAASDIAERGGEAVRQVVSTMGDINTSAKRIVDIIGVINGISFQTNILALNAAVEAARAGEQGRGFAVVASEVRNLAHRSAEAAKEIQSLITQSVERVETGTKLVHQAGSTMGEVVDSVKRVTGIMSEISLASQEQSSGIAQVSQAVASMDQATQQNAALVEEAAAAAQSLRDQTGALVDMVSVFKVGTAPH